MEFLAALISIVVINLVLSGDNAVVIAMASRNLSVRQQKLAIFWGSAGAIGLRVILTTGAVFLLKVPLLKAIGGALLVWIAVKLLKEDECEKDACKEASCLWDAIKTIIIADFLMSLDNVLAVAGASRGNVLLLIIGLAMSIPIIIYGSQIIVFLMKKFPLIIYVGAGILGWTAGEMIAGDQQVAAYFQRIMYILDLFLPALLTVFVVAFGYWLNLRQKKKLRET
ncbi:MAG: TerC family protein [Bacillota bacterium]